MATTSRDLVQLAREKADRAQLLLQKRLQSQAARDGMVADYAGGAGMSVRAIAEKYGVSQETVRAGLKRNGVYAPQRRARISEDSRSRIIDGLRSGQSKGEVALSVGASAATVTKIGLEAGVLKKGATRTRRTETDMQAIQDLDTDCRAIHGAGLLTLGTALREWQKRKQETPPTEAAIQAAPTAEAVPQPDGPVPDGPINAGSRAYFEAPEEEQSVLPPASPAPPPVADPVGDAPPW